MTSEYDNDGMWLGEYATNEQLADVYFKRAVGQLPEMEVSKAVAKFLGPRIRPGTRLLDVGCGAAHYLRSLKRESTVPFEYVGVDYHSQLLNKAKEAWKDEPGASFRKGSIFDLPTSDGEFDIVMCNNLVMHLPSVVGPIGELIRSSSGLVFLRTLVGERSFRIQEVFNSEWYDYTDVLPRDEFSDDGTPVAYSYSNIYSKGYLEGIVRRHAPNARVEFAVDDQFSPEAIERSASNEQLPSATRIVDGKQVKGYILRPDHFVIIEL